MIQSINLTVAIFLKVLKNVFNNKWLILGNGNECVFYLSLYFFAFLIEKRLYKYARKCILNSDYYSDAIIIFLIFVNVRTLR